LSFGDVGEKGSDAVAHTGKRKHRQVRRRAFTLLELLLTIGIITLLISIVLPAMRACRQASRRVKCLSQMHRATWEFRIFADDFAVRTRGDSANFGPQRFEIEDFQESLYRIAEYWDLPPGQHSAAYNSPSEVMMCPEGPSYLQRSFRAGGCLRELVTPWANVSLALNMRLDHRVWTFNGNTYLVPAIVTSKILNHPNVPLLMDVDGEKATGGVEPFYTAPPIDPDDPYGDGTYWFPSYRHQGRINVAFVGGHVLSSNNPLDEPGWDWAYQPSE